MELEARARALSERAAAHHRRVRAEEAALGAEAKALAEAKKKLRDNEAFFDELRRRLEAEEDAAATLQAGARGLKARQQTETRRLVYTGGL